MTMSDTYELRLYDNTLLFFELVNDLVVFVVGWREMKS